MTSLEESEDMKKLEEAMKKAAATKE